MFVIIPIGANLKKENNNIKPKPLVNVLGKSIIEYLLDNLNTSNIEKVFIPYDKELKNYFFEDYLENKYKNIKFEFFILNENTSGPLDTILKLLNTLDEEDCPIINLDCDNFYNIDIIEKWNGENKIFLFEEFGENNSFSFVKLNENKTAIEIIEERNRISNLACTGAYGFNSWKQLKNVGNTILEKIKNNKEKSNLKRALSCESFKKSIDLKENTIQQINFLDKSSNNPLDSEACEGLNENNRIIRSFIYKNQGNQASGISTFEQDFQGSSVKFYISLVIQELIKTENFKYEIISNNNYICLGNQFHIRLFCSNYSNINNINKVNFKKKIFCFELDNTLFTNPQIENDYTTVKPILENINVLKYIKNNGHKIIIHTSRNLNNLNNLKKNIKINIGKITFETLEKYEIPFDEIYFGKPNADFYIDSRNISSYSNLEKELGFYNDLIEPRSFNDIELNQIEIYKKTSNDLKGQIMYYLNIPNELKELFPFFLNYDYQDYKWYNMEKINGVSMSKLYISEELTEVQFINLLYTISKIHKFNKLELACDKNSINLLNIYKNYSNKIKKRYQSYDYSNYNNHEKYYNKLFNALKKYEEQEEGIKSIIHGDPVFTNIIINRFNQIKLIDMRGSIDDQITIYGDELYDWAKIYQSLIGYDEILDNIEINYGYRQLFINIFEEYINKLYNNNLKYLENIKLITISLLFSLIPLHDNQNCIKFYNLLEKYIEDI
jgi:capsule biosynthesis phosphatase